MDATSSALLIQAIQETKEAIFLGLAFLVLLFSLYIGIQWYRK